jgi:peptide/nickel transport system substrate-binding protein
MKRILVVLSVLLFTATFAFAGAAGAEQVTGGRQAIGVPLGIHPDIWMFATLSDLEEYTGEQITSFGEAPEMAALVARGELPPVEQRLPEEPFVVVRNEIGRYGGTLRTVHDGSVGGLVLSHLKLFAEQLNTYDTTFTDFGPNVLQEVEVLPGNREFIWHLRKGMKWSDGVPITADDIVFWSDAEAKNTELNPGGIWFWRLAGEAADISKIDDFTVKVTWPAPYGYFPQAMNIFNPALLVPQHYMSQFHPDYTTAAELEATKKEEGYSDWVTLWTAQRTAVVNENPDMPGYRAWIPTTDGYAQLNRMIRNPYYWKIDTAGNQLPYINEIESVRVGDKEGMKLKMISGDTDWVSAGNFGWDAANYAFFKEYELQGGYTVKVYDGPDNVGNYNAINLNVTHKDPFYRELFNKKDFRVALSIGIDRDEINEVLFRGGNTPYQIGPTYTDWGWSDFFKQYTEYDPDEANRILDELGLEWNSRKTVRLRPDGEPMQLVLLVQNWRNNAVPMAEMIAQTWADLGLDIALKPYASGASIVEQEQGDYEVIMSGGSGGDAMNPAVMDTEQVMVGDNWDVSTDWAKWLNPVGDPGVAPPEEEGVRQDVLRLYEITQEFKAEADKDKREEMIVEIFEINMKHLWTIGVLNGNPELKYQTFATKIRNQVGIPHSYYHHVPAAWYYDE